MLHTTEIMMSNQNITDTDPTIIEQVLRTTIEEFGIERFARSLLSDEFLATKGVIVDQPADVSRSL